MIYDCLVGEKNREKTGNMLFPMVYFDDMKKILEAIKRILVENFLTKNEGRRNIFT